MTIRVLICDDHEMVREALASVLNNEDDIDVLLTTHSVSSTISMLEQNPDTIDVAVLDVRLGDGTGHDITQWIKTHASSINVVLLTSFLEDEILVDGYTSKASAIVLKGAPSAELVQSIRDAAAGLQLINPTQVRVAAKRLNSVPLNALSVLDATDREIAHLVAQGLTDKDIAATLHFSVQTVKNRISKILSRIGVANRTQLAVLVATAISEKAAPQ